MKIKAEWEVLESEEDTGVTSRMKVIGGWIFRSIEWPLVKETDQARSTPDNIALCFIPDPNHEWEIE